MTKNKQVEEIINEEEGSPAVFLRKVDVIICNGEDEEPVIIKAEPEKTEE